MFIIKIECVDLNAKKQQQQPTERLNREKKTATSARGVD